MVSPCQGGYINDKDNEDRGGFLIWAVVPGAMEPRGNLDYVLVDYSGTIKLYGHHIGFPELKGTFQGYRDFEAYMWASGKQVKGD